MIAYDFAPLPNTLPVLTLVHGFSHNRRYFSAAIPQLLENYHLLQIDLRGHGGSSDVSGPFGIVEYANDIEEVLDREQIGRTHLWGSHTGAAVGLLLAHRAPNRFESLVLEGAVLPGYPMPRTGELLDRARATARSLGVEAAKEEWFDHGDWFDYMRENPQSCNASGHRLLLDEFSGAPWLSELTPAPVPEMFEHLDQIKQRVLAYNGEHDVGEFKEVAQVLEEQLGDIRRVEMAHAGGFPLWENPKDVLPMVCQFLAA